MQISNPLGILSPISGFAMAFCAIVGCSNEGNSSGVTTTAEQTVDPWNVSDELAAKLGEPTALAGFEDYEIRPPSEFRIDVSDFGPDEKIYRWMGPEFKHSDSIGTISTLYVSLRRKEPPVTAEELMKDQLAIDSRDKSDWNATASAGKELGGLSFLQTSFSCRHERFGNMRGFVMTAVDDDVSIRIYSADFEASEFATVPLAHASALTFRKHSE